MNSTVLTADRIVLDGNALTREEAIAEAAFLLVTAGAVTPDYQWAMLERESLVSTFMGNGVAIPHGTNEAKESILFSAMTIVRYQEPIDWDGNDVYLVAAIAGKDGGHMAVLSSLALVLSSETAIQLLMTAETPEQVLELLHRVNTAA